MPSLGVIVDSLPKLSQKFELEDSDLGLSFVRSRDPQFVMPRVAPHGDSEARIVLLVAPAAVGKSAVASEIAATTGGPLLDLATAQVGQGSFAGTVMNAFGFNEGPKFLTALRDGQATIVVDALDEAEIRAGEHNFLPFLHELCRFARLMTGDASVVLLARTQTAEWVELTFESEDVPIAIYSIEFFERDGAEELIDRALDSLYDEHNISRIHRQNPVPYHEVRDLLFQKIYTIFDVNEENAWGSPEVRRFLGYAPVLRAVAEYLFVPNHHTLVRGLSGPPTSVITNDSQWRLLLAIVEDLLLREQEKVVAQLLPALSHTNGTEIARALYTPEEQCARLVARVHPEVARPSLPALLDARDRKTYDDALVTAVSVHPFLDENGRYVNAVFRDYVHAHALYGLAESPQGGDAVRNFMLSTSYLPGPLLSNFLPTIADAWRDGTVQPRDVGFILESIRSRLQQGDVLSSTILIKTSADRGVCHISVETDRTEGDRSQRSTQFYIESSDQALTLTGRISNTGVVSYRAVEISGRGDAVVIGPDTVIYTKDLYILAKDVRVTTREGQDVELVAKEFLSHPLQEVVDEGEGSVRAWWPGIAYPWQRLEDRTLLLPPSNDDAVIAEFRRLVMRFRNRWSGKLYMHREFIDNIVVGGNALASKVLSALRRVGVINISGVEYELDLQQLAVGGVNWVDLRENRLSDQARGYILGLVRSVP